MNINYLGKQTFSNDAIRNWLIVFCWHIHVAHRTHTIYSAPVLLAGAEYEHDKVCNLFYYIEFYQPQLMLSTEYSWHSDQMMAMACRTPGSCETRAGGSGIVVGWTSGDLSEGIALPTMISRSPKTLQQRKHLSMMLIFWCILKLTQETNHPTKGTSIFKIYLAQCYGKQGLKLSRKSGTL